MIDHDVCARVLSAAMRSGGEFAEVYAEDKRSTSAGLDDGRVEQLTSGRDRGAGLRVVAGETTGFAHTSDLSESGLLAAAEAAAAAARQGGGGTRTVALGPSSSRRINTVERYPDEIAKADKVELLRRMDDAARSAGGEIVQVSAGYGDSRKRVLVANSDGLLADDEVVRCLMRVTAVADSLVIAWRAASRAICSTSTVSNTSKPMVWPIDIWPVCRPVSPSATAVTRIKQRTTSSSARRPSLLATSTRLRLSP